MRLLPPVAAAALALTLLAAPTQAAPTPADPAEAGPTRAVPARSISPAGTTGTTGRVPSLRVKKLAGGLDVVWDVKQLDRRRLIFTQRDRATVSTLVKGRVKRLKGFPSNRIWVSGETGLTSIAVDPEDDRRVYTCQGWRKGGGGTDVRVIAWTLDAKARNVLRKKVLVKGLPVSSGRHGGCRLLIDDEGSLIVGTGDAAIGTVPRDLDSLGGKTLRLDRRTGRPWPTNVYASSSAPRRYVHTFGHRNVQGLAQRRDGTVFSMEHGPDVDDEVNLLVNGGDYGWHPVPGYNESVPMTDQALPGTQIEARWSSGSPTVATSGGTFVYGGEWGAYDGALAVACLKANRVIFMTFDQDGDFVRARVPAVLTQYGRLRSVTQVANGDLLVTTSDGDGQDMILRVRP
jgi:aldose sugar dehydrogenase